MFVNIFPLLYSDLIKLFRPCTNLVYTCTVYSLDPPLRKLHVKKTGVGHKPGGQKGCPLAGPLLSQYRRRRTRVPRIRKPLSFFYEYMYPFWMCCPLVTTRAW